MHRNGIANNSLNSNKQPSEIDSNIIGINLPDVRTKSNIKTLFYRIFQSINVEKLIILFIEESLKLSYTSNICNIYICCRVSSLEAARQTVDMMPNFNHNDKQTFVSSTHSNSVNELISLNLTPTTTTTTETKQRDDSELSVVYSIG